MTDPRDIALPQPGRVGQATAIEQSRAVAEVYAAVMVARDVPRNVQTAIGEMRQVCAMSALAERAFFEYPRGKDDDGKSNLISGSTVHLARELARCWGNIQHGVAELRRDDEHGQSEMLAFAWDLQSNARVQTIFIVPHKRDKKGGAVKIVDMRTLYENNANQGARRVRECIFAVLPVWFRQEAELLCHKTLKDGGGKPLAQRVADALGRFADLDVSEADLVRRVGKPVAEWTAATVGNLVVTYGSLTRGEITREEAFPPAVVTSAEIRQQSTPPAAAPPPAGRFSHEWSPDDVARWHGTGHGQVGDSARRAFDPECPVCLDADPVVVEAGQTHLYNHTMDWLDDCPLCQQEKAWRSEVSGDG